MNEDLRNPAFAEIRELADLSELSDAAIDSLAEVADVRDLPTGTVLFSEGDLHPWTYMVLRGTIQLDMVTAKRGRKTIFSVGAGDLLAWSSILGDGVMTATAVACEPSRIIAFDAQRLQQRLDADPHLGYCFMQAVARAVSRRLLATRLQLLDVYV